MGRYKKQVHFLILLLVAITVSCNLKQAETNEQSATQSSAVPTTGTGTPFSCSAKLTYDIVVDNAPLFVGVSHDVIPLVCGVAPDDVQGQLIWGLEPRSPTESQPMYGSSNDGSFLATIAGFSQGDMCPVVFELAVAYNVKGIYYPLPKCSFEVMVRAKVLRVVSRASSCQVPYELLKQYPAETLFIPPPEKMIAIPGGPETETTEKIHPFTEVKLTLSEIAVPESSGCQW